MTEETEENYREQPPESPPSERGGNSELLLHRIMYMYIRVCDSEMWAVGEKASLENRC